MASSIIYLSDCTPLYTTLDSPARILLVSGFPLHSSARLEWSPPPNSENVLVDSYIVRYKLTGAPLTQTISEKMTFFPTVIIAGLSNGFSYDFWVVAKNRFGESPHSPTISVIPGAAPSATQIVRRAYHSTVGGNGIDGSNPQKLGIEFTPPLTQNGAQSLTFTAKYTRLNGGGAMTDISYTEIYSVQSNEVILDASGMSAILTTGIKGNYIRKELIPPTVAPAFQSGNYRFQVFSSNIYGISAAPDLSFALYLYSNTDANASAISRFTAPTFASYSVPANGGIVGVDASDSFFRFRWKQYRGTGTGSTGITAYTDWVYRIQYTDDKDNWYYPPLTVLTPETAKYPEYSRAYDRTRVGSGTADFEYFIDISRNVVNGRRYYVRYCVVNAGGDTSEYTQVTNTNTSLVSCIPGRLPNPPPIFNANSGNRIVRLYFNWQTTPPSLELTGGLPILNYRIERYTGIREGGIFTIIPGSITVFDNITGPFYQDTYEIYVNGTEYQYRIYTRTSIGLSVGFNSVNAAPSRPSDVVRNVFASIDSGQITLNWTPPNVIDSSTPIVQYYIEYREYNLFDVSNIPAGNIVGPISSQFTISNTIQDMNSILVDDTLWAKLNTDVVRVFTNSPELSYTIRNLINNKTFVFRVGAVTHDSARRKIIGFSKIIGVNNPYLQRPVIIGRVPAKLTNVVYENGDSNISITWTSSDINNTEGIVRFIVEYGIAINNVEYSQRRTFDYINSLIFNDGSATLKFNVIIDGLSNNVTQTPDTRTNSYIMQIYAESSLGFTNGEDKVKLQDLIFTDIFEEVQVPRRVRPKTIPSVIAELRT